MMILNKMRLNLVKDYMFLKSKHHVRFAFLFIAMLCILAGCVTSNNSLTSTKGPKIFLVNELNNSIEGIDIDFKEILDQSNVNEIIDYVFVLLNRGVSSSTFKPTIENIDIILYYSVDGKNVTINFASSYYDLAIDKEIYLRSSVIKSLTSFDLVDSVEFFVSGVPLKLDSNKSLGRQYFGDVLVNYDEANSREDLESVTIYLPNKNLSRLVATYTTVTVTPNKKLEEIIVDKLLDSKDPIMPNDVKLLNAYTHEGICFVDFSSEFQTSLLPNGISERIAIYSLVNSLSELSNITNVQILVEGEVASTFQGTLSLNRIFTKNYSLIESDFGGD